MKCIMIRRPKKFNGNFISRHFYPNYFRSWVNQINRGECYDWAYYAHRLFGLELWTTDWHAWVKEVHTAGNRHYDSESPNGVKNLLNLNFHRRNSYPIPWQSQSPTQLSLEDFKDFWDEIGAKNRYHWDSILEVNIKRVLGKRYSELTPIFPNRSSYITLPN